jgi:hypothetical protein
LNTHSPAFSLTFTIFAHPTLSFLPARPSGVFLTKIFHPNVSKAGEICVNTLKRDWQSAHTLRHVLLVIRCLLVEPNPESALNEDAGKLLLEDYEGYARHAKLMTSIHAKPQVTEGATEASAVTVDKSAAEKKKAAATKKSLKRL